LLLILHYNVTVAIFLSPKLKLLVWYCLDRCTVIYHKPQYRLGNLLLWLVRPTRLLWCDTHCTPTSRLDIYFIEPPYSHMERVHCHNHFVFSQSKKHVPVQLDPTRASVLIISDQKTKFLPLSLYIQYTHMKICLYCTVRVYIYKQSVTVAVITMSVTLCHLCIPLGTLYLVHEVLCSRQKQQQLFSPKNFSLFSCCL
jgi:hypothetical protein